MLFSENFKPSQLRKYFKFNNIETTNNVSYRNDIADTVSKTIRTKLNKSGEYEIGETLICKTYTKSKGFIKLKNSDEFKTRSNIKMNKNCSFDIVEIKEESLVISQSVCDLIKVDQENSFEYEYEVIATKNDYLMISYNVLIELNLKFIRSNFVHSYCRTCHSLQGMTLNDNITIFDYSLPFVTRKWLWVAITRTTSLNKVRFYDGRDGGFNMALLNKYFHQKVNQYVEQDKKAKRNIDMTNYINVEWLHQNINKGCVRCSNPFNLSFTKCSVKSDISANRIDNELAHTIHNLEPMCVSWNCSLSDK